MDTNQERKMKITEIKLCYGETIKPRDYESRKCEMEVHVQLEEGDDSRKITESILAKLKTRVRLQLLEDQEKKTYDSAGLKNYADRVDCNDYEAE
jgi:hypothetical protein